MLAVRSFPTLALGALLLAAALAACGSGAATTTTPLPTVTIAGATAAPTAAASSTASQTFVTSGGTLGIGPYANAAGTTVTLASTWGPNNQLSTSFQGFLSYGTADVFPTDAAWIPYNLGGSVIVYVEFTALPATIFQQSPQLTFTLSAAAVGSACTIGSLSTAGTWQTILSGGVLSNGNKTIAFQAQTLSTGIVNIGNAGTAGGPSYLALVCQ